MKTSLLKMCAMGLFLAGCGPIETGEAGSGDTATSEEALRRVNPCAMVKCWAGTHCEAAPTGGATCVADNPCLMVKCWAGTHCEPAKGGGSSCVPDTNPCMLVKCIAGTHCEVDPAGAAVCAADLNPCATVRCGFGTTCQVVNGQAVCQ